MKYFISDTHFGHQNVIGYCMRPFADAYEMDSVMLANLQQRLTDEDALDFLGDWSMSQSYYELIKNVPFRHLYFILTRRINRHNFVILVRSAHRNGDNITSGPAHYRAAKRRVSRHRQHILAVASQPVPAGAGQQPIDRTYAVALQAHNGRDRHACLFARADEVELTNHV